MLAVTTAGQPFTDLRNWKVGKSRFISGGAQGAFAILDVELFQSRPLPPADLARGT